MLTAYQVETIAYLGEGFVLHRECAIRETSTITVEKADAGFTDTGLTPLIRYSVDEWAGEEAYYEAEYRLDAFEDDHPRLAVLLGVNRAGIEETSGGCTFAREEGRNRWRILDRLADKIPAGPTCDHCGGLITEPPLGE